MTRHRHAVVAALAGAALAVPGGAAACRCPPPALETAFERADVVLFARVVARAPLDGDMRLGLAPIGEPFKGRLERGAVIVTAPDSAGCGIATAVGGVLLVFGERDGTHPGRLRVHSCNGTRVFAPAGLAAEQGFADVPARHVVAQLQLRHAAALLREASRQAPRESDPASLRLVGLVRLAGEQAVLRRPEAGAPVLARPRGSDGLVTREIAYEEPAAVVYARVAGWLRVRLSPASRPPGDDGFGWVAEPAGGGYVAYESLLPHRLTYLAPQVLRYLWPEPGAGLPHPLPDPDPPHRREWPAVVHEARRVAGQLWLRVDVADRSPCTGRASHVVVAGWLPAYGVDGEPAAWFHSRGC